MDAYAFINFDGTEDRAGYPLDSFTEDELAQLDAELGGVFRNTDAFIRADLYDSFDTAYGVVTLLGTPCFALSLSYPEQGVTVLLARPARSFLSSTMLSAVSLSAFLALSLILLIRCLKMRRADGSAVTPIVRGRLAAAPALLVLVSAVVCFAVMLLFLENTSTTAYTNTARLDALRFELRYAEKQKKLVGDEYYERYLVRADAVSHLLSDKPEQRTRETLRRCCAAAQAEYMMLFDESGTELFSSNAYTGFAVGSEANDETAAYRAVLMGYPHILTEPAADPVTGEIQFRIASLITDEEGLPDGFLLTAVRADDLSDALNTYSPSVTVSKFAVQDGQSAAVVDEKSGLFTAHTDPALIGKTAADIFSPAVLGRGYEGFTLCDGEKVYLSAASDGNQNTLVFTLGLSSELLVPGIAVLLGLIMLIVCLVFYPWASALCAGLPLSPQNAGGLPRRRNPLVTFLYGYVAFLTVFTLLAWIMSRRGYWPAFRYIFGGSWSRGVHLFSLWASLLFFSVTLSAVMLLRAMLARADEHLSLQTRTISRLVDSLITYAAVIVIVCCILTMFGVNTAAFLASAGIVSIAIGMGAKDLIADILAGLFLVFEGSVHVGDAVTVGGWNGTVTDMGIRTMEIANDAGDVKIISNARISEIVNKSRNRQN